MSLTEDTYTPKNCIAFSTKPSRNIDYLAIDNYMDFTSVVPGKTVIESRTGGPLEDYTAVDFTCDASCFYDGDDNTFTNRISLVLSKSKTAGRISPTDLITRKQAIDQLVAKL